MSRDGYLSWTKSVNVKAGSVLWLNYARLYPENPTVTSVTTYDALTSVLVAPNRKQLATVGEAGEGAIYFTPLNDGSTTTRRVQIEAGTATTSSDASTDAYQLVAWDGDSQYVIVKHDFDSKTEYLSVNAANGDAINITTVLGVSTSRLEYAVGNRNVVYLVTDNYELRRGDLSAATLSGPLLSNVEDFAQADRDIVTYETRRGDDGRRSVGYLTNGASKSRNIQTVTDDGGLSFKLRIGTYYGDKYLVVAYGDTTTIYTAELPASDSSTALNWTRVGWLTTTGGVKYLGFSPGTHRIVYAQMTNASLIYDLETDVLAKTTFQGDLSRQLDWVDTFHIGATAANACYFYDFDGTNGRLVASNVIDAPVTISENDSYFYYFAPQDSRAVLKRVRLINQ
jgi:hypothetical protein